MGETTVDDMADSSGMVTPSLLQANARDLEQELVWFAQLVDERFKPYLQQDADGGELADIEPPDLGDSDSPYARFLQHYQLTFAERTALILSLTPHIRPQLLDVFFTKNRLFDRKFTEFGGVCQGSEGDFFPTLETLVFLLAGNDLEIRFQLQIIFERDHFFVKHNILRLIPDNDNVSLLKAPLRLSDEYLSYFTAGTARQADFGVNFPAQLIETQLEWEDLVLHPGTRRQIEEIETWIQYGETLMNDWDMAAKLRPGHRCLFHGPPGTGKTMTACLLGKASGHEVYKIDLSLVVSKYIGETEKNLAKVFDQAQHRGWILFFDEADALFGKRVEGKDAVDHYANQGISFLLQRIETFDGIAILASNLKDNLDQAFMRRFESVIYFPMPREQERLRIWQQGFSAKARLGSDLNMQNVAVDHKLSGGAIMNVVRHVSLQSLKEDQRQITQEDINQGIRMEYAKEGRTA